MPYLIQAIVIGGVLWFSAVQVAAIPTHGPVDAAKTCADYTRVVGAIVAVATDRPLADSAQYQMANAACAAMMRPKT